MQNSFKRRITDKLDETRDYQAHLVSVSFEIRIFNILIGMVCASLIKKFFNISLSKEVFIIFAAWLITSVMYTIPFKMNLFKTRRQIENVHLSYYFFGVIYATALAHYLGGAEWIAFFFYFFDLVYANVLMNRLRGILVAFYIAVCYFTLVLAEFIGVLPHVTIFHGTLVCYSGDNYFLVTNMVVIGTVFFLMAFSMGLFSKMQHDREKSLIESKNRFLAKSTRLEEMTRELRRRIAENRYIKRAAMGYVEKKEYELESVKKDLEEQIDKLRKTQKSMVFMIEDLNAMSSELKDGRDHLEEKVKERTDELLAINQKLHRSERLAFLGKLSGSVTHELRNPLAVLKNAAYFLKSKLAKNKDEKVRKYLETMEKEIMVIDSIIDDIMGFVKTRSPELEEVSLEELIEDTLTKINIPKLVKIKKEIKKVPKIKCDISQIIHALINIANNAIMAMKGNGILYFRTYQDGEYACIEIEDSGPGIPPDKRDLIFEPLYSNKPKGTGLGLPIAKMMVENHNGKIEFDSELGKGTVFKILLPFDLGGNG